MINIKNMIKKNKFDIHQLRGTLGKIRDWMGSHHIPPRLLILILGIISTIWFLIRVIPKPSRATYPCIRVAAPFMSSMIIYLLAVGGLTVFSRKSKRKIFNTRYTSAFLLVFAVVVAMAVIPSDNTGISTLTIPARTGPDDGPNQPVGSAIGVNPGRVVWAWNPKATNEKCNDLYFKPENTNQKVVSKMFNESVKKLSGKQKSLESWDAIFRNFNIRRHQEDRGYTKGEKIFIKINQTSSRGKLRQADKDNGYYYPTRTSTRPGNAPRQPNLGTVETNPFIVLELLRQLVNECGVNQSDISIGDPMNPTYGHNYDAWSAEFPHVLYVDRLDSIHGRTLIHSTKNDLLFYSDKYQTDKLYDIIENADYMINVANFKPHLRAGITLTAKNHFGSHSRTGAYHLHYSHVSPVTIARPTNAGYNKYRVMVDLMGSKYLGQNTVLFIIDGLYGGGSGEGGSPVKYYMMPFDDDWSNSIFISQDQVALESVCYDFLRTEWNGTYAHHPRNNRSETMPSVNGVDDYLHQAADKANWPEGITYDPDNSGKPIPSLGIHEHWNNPVNKQYSRNLGKSYGIELISIPEKIVGMNAPRRKSETSGYIETEAPSVSADSRAPRSAQGEPSNTVIGDSEGSKFTSVTLRSFDEGFKGKKFHAAVVNGNNRKWFLTDAGIVGGNYDILPKNSKIPVDNLNNLVYELSYEGPGIWITSENGVTFASVPVDTNSKATTYLTSNSGIISDTVLSVAVGRNNLRWFGTDKGISALYDGKWLAAEYLEKYPEWMFMDFPITAMATTLNGDSLYVATAGAGVTRVFRNDVDAISGASEIAPWGPIEIPSYSVYSLCITRDGTQWFGTDKGVARHVGYNTLENWTVFNIDNGLVNNFVQAIAVDPEGKLWFGTKGGVSVYDGSEWTSYTTEDGLISNNILSIMVDKNGSTYLGTDNGIMVYRDGRLTCYQ
jgi:hypothetical protein